MIRLRIIAGIGLGPLGDQVLHLVKAGAEDALQCGDGGPPVGKLIDIVSERALALIGLVTDDVVGPDEDQIGQIVGNLPRDFPGGTVMALKLRGDLVGAELHIDQQQRAAAEDDHRAQIQDRVQPLSNALEHPALFPSIGSLPPRCLPSTRAAVAGRSGDPVAPYSSPGMRSGGTRAMRLGAEHWGEV